MLCNPLVSTFIIISIWHLCKVLPLFYFWNSKCCTFDLQNENVWKWENVWIEFNRLEGNTYWFSFYLLCFRVNAKNHVEICSIPAFFRTINTPWRGLMNLLLRFSPPKLFNHSLSHCFDWNLDAAFNRFQLKLLL